MLLFMDALVTWPFRRASEMSFAAMASPSALITIAFFSCSAFATTKRCAVQFKGEKRFRFQNLFPPHTPPEDKTWYLEGFKFFGELGKLSLPLVKPSQLISSQFAP
jgi:hypothetical protein